MRQVTRTRQGHQNPLRGVIDWVFNGNLSDAFVSPTKSTCFLLFPQLSYSLFFLLLCEVFLEFYLDSEPTADDAYKCTYYRIVPWRSKTLSLPLRRPFWFSIFVGLVGMRCPFRFFTFSLCFPSTLPSCDLVPIADDGVKYTLQRFAVK
jgi:hypothetical protein